MKPNKKEDYDRRAKECLKNLIYRFQSYEERFPDEFNEFLKESAIKRNTQILQTYFKDQ